MTLGVPEAWSRVAREYRRLVAPTFLAAARRLCREVGIGPGARVLDIACGPGTAALAARELGAAVVVGVDYAVGMVAEARERARGRGGLYFAAADALALPVAPACFDAVVSSFGFIFAADPERAAGEAARALRPGGRLGLLAWAPEGSVRAYSETAFRHADEPAPAHDPFGWGLPGQAAAWLAPEIGNVETIPLEVPFEAASPAEAWRIHRNATGRMAAVYAALDEAGRRSLDADMERFFEQFRATGGRVVWPREALIIRGTRR